MSADRSHEFTKGLYGWITHTDLASDDPEATREWCESVLGWSFQEPFPTAGAESVDPPTTIMEGVRVAMVRAPGGVLIGFSGPTA